LYGGDNFDRARFHPRRQKRGGCAAQHGEVEETRTVTSAQEPRLRTAERAENFPVALRMLPPRFRGRLLAVYAVVRTIDDLGDEGSSRPAARVAALEAFRADLASVWDPAREPRSEVLRRLQPVAREINLPREPFEHLIQANLADQRVTRYADRAALMDYCALSANPIGRLVLAVFEISPTPDLQCCADRICTGLQLLEHWQDVGEDRRRGRVYLPADAMAAAGVPESDLDRAQATPALRRLILDETERALALLDRGAGMVRSLRGWARPAVAGYVAGGRAAADALRRTGGDVLSTPARRRRRDVVRHLVAELARSVR
jgi:squalene synthase HpnC